MNDGALAKRYRSGSNCAVVLIQLLLPILQSAMWDDPRRTLLAFCFPSRDPSGYFRAAVCALYVDRRDNACPVEGKRETRELEERTVFGVWHAEKLRSRR
jgi:hypothetical protein